MEKKDFTNYKFRCSSLGKLMTSPQKKSEVLSETTKTYLRELWIEEVYGRKKDISNKYMEKGNFCEEDGFDIAKHYYGKLLIKNQEQFENDFITGTPDCIKLEPVIDIKNSWDIHTFMAADGSNKDYQYQGLGYMWLTGKEFFALTYTLCNAPEHLIEAEIKTLCYKRGITPYFDDDYDKLVEEVNRNMVFNDIDPDERVKVFMFTYDPQTIELLKIRVYEARAYMNKLSLKIEPVVMQGVKIL